MVETWDTAEALEHEIELLERVSRDPESRFLWFWQAQQSLVAPRKLGAKPDFATAAVDLTAEGWPVLLRSTGGDVTPQGPGIVNVTHVYVCPPDTRFDLEQQYDRLCAPIEAALGKGASRGWQPGAFCDGAHNVQWQGRKFAGTAMRFRQARADKSRYAVMAHALMLFAPPPEPAIDAINRFLELIDEPRVISAEAHTGLPESESAEAFLKRLVEEFTHSPGLTPLRQLP